MTTSRRDFLKSSSSLSLVALFPAGASLNVALSEESSLPSASATLGHPLMAPDLAHSLNVRCLAKPVFASQVLDDMEVERGWVASPAVKLSYTQERARAGSRSLRFSTSMRNEEFIRASRLPNGTFSGTEAAFVGQPFAASATLSFKAAQDWSAYNRLSLWCYLHPTKLPTTSLSLQFLCEGASAGPWDPIPIHAIGDLKSGEWNHLTWEISEYPRNKITQFIILKPNSGLALATDDPEMTFDFDQLALERVAVEPVSG